MAEALEDNETVEAMAEALKDNGTLKSFDTGDAGDDGVMTLDQGAVLLDAAEDALRPVSWGSGGVDQAPPAEWY